MKENKAGENIIISYIYSRRYHIAAAFIFECFILILFCLYQMPKDAVSYAILFSGTLLFLMLFADYIAFRKRHNHLNLIRKKKYISLDDLPETHDIIERDYRELLIGLYHDKMELISIGDKNRAEMLDYYTMWVHQIKTPIAAMGLLLQTKSGNNKKSELSRELFKIEQYVEMVLQFLRMEDSSSDLVLKEVKLYPIVRQAVLKYANLFFYSNLSLRMEEFDCTVLTDEKWIAFVIEQLLSNAIKYTKGGSISIYLKEKDSKILVIEDTGIGIQREDIPRIFEKGYTGFNGRMDKKSTGIGLYLVRKILTKLSHKIMIESEVGEGTKVSLMLALDRIEFMD